MFGRLTSSSFSLHRTRDLFLGHLRVLAQRKGDVLEDGHRVEERAALEQHPELLAHAVQLFFGMIGDVFVFDDDAAGVGRFQSEHVPQRDRLAAARSAEDDQHFAAIDLEIGAAQHLLRAVRLVDVAELDEEIARMPPAIGRFARLGAAVGWMVVSVIRR